MANHECNGMKGIPAEKAEKGSHAGNQKHPETAAVRGVKGRVSRNEAGGKHGLGLCQGDGFLQEPRHHWRAQGDFTETGNISLMVSIVFP